MGSPPAAAQLLCTVLHCGESGARASAALRGSKACRPGLPGRAPNPSVARLSPPGVHVASVTQEPCAQAGLCYSRRGKKRRVIFQF